MATSRACVPVEASGRCAMPMRDADGWILTQSVNDAGTSQLDSLQHVRALCGVVVVVDLLVDCYGGIVHEVLDVVVEELLQTLARVGAIAENSGGH